MDDSNTDDTVEFKKYTCACVCGCRAKYYNATSSYCGACRAWTCPESCEGCKKMKVVDDDGICDACVAAADAEDDREGGDTTYRDESGTCEFCKQSGIYVAERKSCDSQDFYVLCDDCQANKNTALHEDEDPGDDDYDCDEQFEETDDE